jgi:AraC-like DNA-binding protein
VATEAGISLRYVQKLLTARGSTCSELIYSLRLDHAAHLLERRASVGTGQHLGEIAQASGFRDYAHFARRFRHRFGHAPGAHVEGGDPVGSSGACLYSSQRRHEEEAVNRLIPSGDVKAPELPIRDDATSMRQDNAGHISG